MHRQSVQVRGRRLLSDRYVRVASARRWHGQTALSNSIGLIQLESGGQSGGVISVCAWGACLGDVRHHDELALEAFDVGALKAMPQT